MHERLELWMSELANNGWQPANTPGNVMLLIIIAFLAVNICKNKKLNLMQLTGNLLLLTVCFVIVLIRR